MDWRAETRWLLRKVMRQAGDQGLPVLVREFEPLRGRASTQLILAEEHYERTWAAPRRAEPEAASQ